MGGKGAPPNSSRMDVNLIKPIHVITLLVELSHKLYSSDTIDVKQRNCNFFERFEL